jgi:hypothetical protein
MKPLRAFLFSESPGGDWASNAFRELEPLIDAVRAALSVENASAAIHVGFWRPETQKIAAIAQAWPGVLLLSDAAIGSLPPPVKVSSLPVGDVDDLSFRLALSGFGYEIADPSAPSVTNLQSIATPALGALGVFEPRGWVEKMLEAMPQLEQTLRTADIWDDESYIANEHELETSTRHSIGMARYTLIAGEKPSASGILNNLHACPPWFLNEKLQNLDTTVRMANVFKGNNLWTVAHIAEKGYNGLLRLPNLGHGSVHGIGRLFYEALINGDAIKRWPSSPLSDTVVDSTFPHARLNPLSVSEVDGQRFRRSPDGLTDEISDLSQTSVKTLQSVWDSPLKDTSTFKPCGWVEKMLEAMPQIEQTLRNADIWDDESYIANEHELEASTRHIIGMARYTLIVGEKPSALGILNNLHACPPWFLNDKFQNMNTTVRMANALNGQKLFTVAHIAAKGYSGLLALPNLGRGSVHGIGQLLFDAMTNGDALKRGSDNNSLNWFSTKSLISDANSDELLQVSRRVTAPSLVEGLVEATLCLNESELGIFSARMGFRYEPDAPQKISDQIGVACERVRHIELKLLRKIQRHFFWELLAERLDGLLAERSSPLLLDGIQAVDPWFKGADKLKNTLIEIFKLIFSNRFCILNIDDVAIISRLSNEEWIDAVDSGKALLRGMVSEKPTEEFVRFQIEALISDKGAELRETLWQHVSSFALWANRQGDTRILFGYGQTAEAVVSVILEDAGMPLHYSEIERRASKFEGRRFDLRRLHKAAASVGMLYGRGTYGFFSHCPLAKDELDQIVSEVEDIISSGDSARQWHTSELMDELLDRGFDFDGRISKYIINIALQSSELLVYMKRMVWGLKGSWSESAASRLDLRQAVISLLESEGMPMTTNEIRDRLFADRGVNGNFQIYPAGNLIKVGTSRWGLAERDIQLKNPTAYFEMIEKHLQDTQEGIHVSEVSSVLGDLDENTSKAFFGYCKGKGLRIDRAQYLYPATWPNSQRVWPNVAVRMALESSPIDGISFEAIFNTVCSLTKRDFKRMQISQILVVMENSVFDPTTEKWKIDRDLMADPETEEELEQGM